MFYQKKLLLGKYVHIERYNTIKRKPKFAPILFYYSNGFRNYQRIPAHENCPLPSSNSNSLQDCYLDYQSPENHFQNDLDPDFEFLAGKRILIFQQRGWARTIGHPLAVRLQNQGVELAAITLKRSTDKFIRTQSEVKYRLIVSHDDVMDFPSKYLSGTKISGDEICRELNITSLWPFAQSLRNHVRSYRDAYYYSFKQNVSDEQIFEYFRAVHEMCRRIFAEFDPEVIVAPNFVSVAHIFMNLFATRRDIPMIGVTDSKVRGLLCFSRDYLDSSGPLNDRFIELADGEESQNLQASRNYIAENRKQLLVPSTMDYIDRSPSLKRELRQMLGRFKRDLRSQNRSELFGPIADAPTPYILLRDFFKRRRYRGHAFHRKYFDLNTNGRFAFFPLQFQPEASIDVVSPRFNNQIETARQIAMSLPGEMTLLVKDHPAMIGYRSNKYLEKVARLPNVKLLHFDTPIAEILNKVELVIATAGTVLIEAAMLKTPCIQLGDLGTTLLLPNVRKHTDMATLSDKITVALQEALNVEDYERRLEHYVAAAMDVGFDLNYFGIWDRGETGNHDDIFRRYVDEIRRSLKQSGKQAHLQHSG